MTTTNHMRPFAGAASTTTQSGPKSTLGSVREAFRHRRAVRAMHMQIERELSTYTTPNEIAELDAMIERSDIDENSEYMNVIDRVRARAI